MENDDKREPKWEPKSIKNRKSDGKKAGQKQRRNLRPKNPSLQDFAGGLGSIFGGAGEGGKLKTANTG